MARQALTIGGAIVGSFFGQPQLGFVIGSLVGNYVDPQVVKTPRIKDLPSQTADEGGYRQVVYGTCWINETNIIDFSDVRRVTQRERQGKGGGPVVESERLYRTYAIGLGEPLEAIRVIRRDGKIVYDVRPGSTILAESAAFAERFRFYTGAEDQLPDPDLEAIHGVGNTPYYRGTAYLVFPNDDLTDTQGRIPTYEVEGVKEVAQPITGKWFYGPVAENGSSGGSEDFYLTADTPEGLFSATPQPLPAEMSGGLTRISVANRRIFFRGSAGSAVSSDNGATWTSTSENLSANYPVYWNGSYYFCGLRRSADGVTWTALPASPANAVAVLIARESDGAVAVSTSDKTIYVSNDNGETWALKRTSLWAIAHGFAATDGTRIWWTEDSTRGLYTDDLFENANSYGTASPEYTPYYGNGYVVTKSFNGRIIRTPADSSVGAQVAIINYAGRDDQNIAYGDGVWACEHLVSAGAPNQHGIYISEDDAASWAQATGSLYGDGGNLVFVESSGPPIIPTDRATVEYVLSDICSRCGISASEYNFSDVADEMLGVTLGGPYTGADAIMLFMPAFHFDLVQPDKVLTAVKRGGASKGSVTAGDFVESPDENILRGQDIEVPRALMLKYLNPGQNYAAPAAVVSRTSPDVRVSGEATAELPISFDETGALRVADRMLKVMWEDLNGEITFSLPSGPWAWLTPTDILTLSLRGGLYRIRVEKVEESAGVLKVTARRDRQSAYTSNLTAPSLPAPTPPPPAQPGATTFVVMNLPALIDEDDRLGVYIAMTGAEDSAWAGAQVAYRQQGATDWIVLGNFTTRAVMGELLAPLPYASPFYTDTTNPLQVSLEYASDQLETLTYTEFLSEGNPAAIVKPDYTAEIVQFRYADDDGDSDWTLTTLQRGRLNTEPVTHSAGARFVMLDGAIFLPLPSSLIGKTLEFRVTSLGTSPETAPTQTLVWNPVYSQLEFQVHDLTLTRGGGTISGAWSPRHRFGTDVNPVASANFTGYRVTLTDGTTTNSFTVTDPAFSTPDTPYVGTITVSVSALNRYTGAGPSVSESI